MIDASAAINSFYNFIAVFQSFFEPLHKGLSFPDKPDFSTSALRGLKAQAGTMIKSIDHVNNALKAATQRLHKPILMIQKAVAVLKKFSNLDPTLMLNGWIGNLYRMLGLEDKTPVGPKVKSTPSGAEEEKTSEVPSVLQPEMKAAEAAVAKKEQFAREDEEKRVRAARLKAAIERDAMKPDDGA